MIRSLEVSSSHLRTGYGKQTGKINAKPVDSYAVWLEKIIFDIQNKMIINFLEPPKPPLVRIIKAIDFSYGNCAKCGSSFYRKWFGLKQTKNCIQPECENYYEND